MSDINENRETVLTQEEVLRLKTLPERIAQAFKAHGDNRRFFLCTDIQRYFDTGALLPIHARSLLRSAERLPPAYSDLAQQAVTFEKWFRENYDLYKEGKL